MKIYNKRGFIEGAVMIALCLLNLLLGIIQHRMDFSSGVLCAILFLLGSVMLARSLSKDASRHDKLEAMDERNRMVKQKAESRALGISRLICFLLILLCTVAYATTENRDFIGILVGLALAWGVSLLTDFFTFVYYDSKI